MEGTGTLGVEITFQLQNTSGFRKSFTSDKFKYPKYLFLSISFYNNPVEGQPISHCSNVTHVDCIYNSSYEIALVSLFYTSLNFIIF